MLIFSAFCEIFIQPSQYHEPVWGRWSYLSKKEQEGKKLDFWHGHAMKFLIQTEMWKIYSIDLSFFSPQVKTQANTIQELRNLQNQRNRHLSSQAGVNRGRFILSRASMLECSKCNEVFPSSNAARDSNCSYHPKAACELSSKMVAEIFPEKGRQCYYWPCCGKIGTKTPPPCHHGTHTLRANWWEYVYRIGVQEGRS